MESAKTLDQQTVDQQTLAKETVPLRHHGRTVAAVFLLLVVANLVHSMVTNENFQWGIVWHYLFHPEIMAGLGRTLILTVVGMAFAILLGILLAACRLSENKVLQAVAGAYLWFVRGTPLLIQLIFLYNLSALYPRLGIGVPFGGPELLGGPTNSVLTLWTVALVGLALHESAYMAEIVRGGLLSVPKHQTEAAAALGMNNLMAFRRIILPQALRVIVPPTGNQVIGIAGQRDRAAGPALLRPDDLHPDVRDHPAADRGLLLVPGLHLRADHLPAAHRALLRPRRSRPQYLHPAQGRLPGLRRIP